MNILIRLLDLNLLPPFFSTTFQKEILYFFYSIKFTWLLQTLSADSLLQIDVLPWRSVIFFSAVIVVQWSAMSASTLTEISQKLLDEVSWSLTHTFVPRWWNLRILSACHFQSGFRVNGSAAFQTIAMRIGAGRGEKQCFYVTANH